MININCLNYVKMRLLFIKKICEGKIINLANINIQNQRNLEFVQEQLKDIDVILQRMQSS